MRKYNLGELEEITLLTIAILHLDAYGVSIKDEIETRLKRVVSMGALHAALIRMEEKGYVKSFDGEATEERVGRPRRYYQITAMGKKAIEHARSSREELWKAIPRVSMDIKPR